MSFLGVCELILRPWKLATIFLEYHYPKNKRISCNSQNTPRRSKLSKMKFFQNDPKMTFLHIFISNSFKAIPKPSKFQSLIFEAPSPCLNSLNLSKSMLLSSIASIIFQITYKTQNLVKCQETLSIKTQSIRKVDRKIHQTKLLSNSPTLNLLQIGRAHV